ncbi:hypothetical protein AMD27_15595 [Acinetobacter sp. TGL-Y2]|nr:hypothetical protein AMD27_15595 [Acinetobacter sp. TGL-Y2]
MACHYKKIRRVFLQIYLFFDAEHLFLNRFSLLKKLLNYDSFTTKKSDLMIAFFVTFLTQLSAI